MRDDDLIRRYLHEDVDQHEVEKLGEEIVQDPDFRRRFIHEVVLDSALREIATEEPLKDELSLMSDSSSIRNHPGIVSPKIAKAIAVAGFSALAAGLLLMFEWFQMPVTSVNRVVATLADSEGASWVSNLPTQTGSELRPGHLELKSGFATLHFNSGASLLLEAPASLEIISAMRVRLIDGSAVIEVPESAIGFVVSTRSGDATDLGTKFGVSVDSMSRTTEFEVFDGEVSVDGETLNEPILLTTSEAIRLRQDGMPSRLTGETGDETAGKESAARIQRIGTDGHAATFIRGNRFPRSRYRELLMVKSAIRENNYDRKIVLTFDASEVPESSVASIQLRLHQVRSPIGFASRLPKTNVFSVYGITQVGAEPWSRKSTWQETPSPSDGELIAEFEIPRSQVSGECIVQSEQLETFIRERMRKPMTFVVVRKTRTIQGSEKGLVHAFASPSHPTLRGPALEFSLLKD